MKIINPLFITFILTSFLIIKKCYSEPYEKYRVKDIYVEFNLAKNTANRKKAVNLAYDKALKRYLRWITLESNENISEIIKQMEPNKVIKGYSIENEKFWFPPHTLLLLALWILSEFFPIFWGIQKSSFGNYPFFAPGLPTLICVLKSMFIVSNSDE